jgi:hypothetical protein
MGMYTQVKIDLMVKDPFVVQLFKYVYRAKERHGLIEIQDYALAMGDGADEFWTSTRWPQVFYGSSAYFDDDCLEFGELEKGVWRLKCSSSLKNYNDEIAKFADWVRQYALPQDKPIVTSLYELCEHAPNTYYSDGHTVKPRHEEGCF